MASNVAEAPYLTSTGNMERLIPPELLTGSNEGRLVRQENDKHTVKPGRLEGVSQSVSQ